MPTANFNLPLIDPAAPISIVNDLNSLATATDSAMGTLATAGDINAVRQIANNAITAASDANKAAQAADTKASTANTAAVGAQSTANKAEATANAAKASADSVASAVDSIQANNVVTVSLGTASLPSSLASSGSLTARVSKSDSSNIALFTVDGATIAFNGGWNATVTMPNKLPENMRPATEQRYSIFTGWFSGNIIYTIEVTFKPNGNVDILVHPHGSVDTYTTSSFSVTYMVGA